MLEYRFGPHFFCIGADILRRIKMEETDTRYLRARFISLAQLMLRGYQDQLREKISSVAVLNAHAGTKDGVWSLYESPGFIGSVQEWINKNDGDYDPLFLLCCNKDNHEITSARSAVVHAEGIAEEGHLTEELVVEFNTQVRVYIPGTGYLPRVCPSQ